MTPAERQKRYRWSGMTAAALEKVARLIQERPEDKELPPIPPAILKAYNLRKAK